MTSVSLSVSNNFDYSNINDPVFDNGRNSSYLYENRNSNSVTTSDGYNQSFQEYNSQGYSGQDYLNHGFSNIDENNTSYPSEYGQEYEDFNGYDSSPQESDNEYETPTTKEGNEESVSLTTDDVLRARLTKLRRYYTNATMTGENDRFGFEQGVMDVELLFNEMNKKFSGEKESLRTELLISEKEREVKVKEWRDRYQKLHEQWEECMDQLKDIQEEKEDLRQQRDLLFCSHKAKKTMTDHGTTVASGQKDKIILKEFFQKRVIFRFLSAVAEAIGAERGAIFVQDHNYLKSIALYPPLSKDGKAVEIKVPSDQGFVGTVFKNKEALNILNAYKDKRFYRKVDNETGFITRVVLCYPLVSPTTERAIGVLQLINKENGEVFTVEDEARMSEYVYLISNVLESVEKLYSFSSMPGEKSDQPPSTPSTNLRRKNIINVKRIGAERDTDYSSDSQKMRKLLIPKEIEEYIRNVEQGWRKAVGESAEYQNKKAQLEEERTQLKSEIGNFEKIVQEKDLQIQDLQFKIQKFQKDIKLQQQNFQDKEKEMKQEVKELKQLHHTLNRQNSSFDQIKLRQSFKVQNRRSSGLQLPQLDAFKSNTSPKNKNQTSGSGSGAGVGIGAGVSSSLVETNYDEIDREPPSISPQNLNSKHRDLFLDMFSLNPVPMLLLNRQFRIWRVNQKFCTLLECSEQDLLGISLTDITVGVDQDTLPKLLQFDVVQGLGIQKPQSKTDTKKTQNQFVFLKVNMQVSVIGQNGQKFQILKNNTLRGPIYCCTFSKKRS